MQGLRAASITAFAAAAALVFAVATSLSQPPGPETLVADAINRGAPGAQGGRVQITIERWSTSQEREAFVEAFRQSGVAWLLRALQETPRVGFLRTPDGLNWDLHYAVQEPDGKGGRRILIATDRLIDFWQAAPGTRSTDYPFSLIELRLGADGKGEGRMSLATRVGLSRDKAHLELQNYSTEPVRLQNVRKPK